MIVKNIPIGRLKPAQWNANRMDVRMRRHLERSLERFGLVQNLVVRRLEAGTYEVLAGNQRLEVLRRSGVETVACVVVDVVEGDARLLSQAMNAIHGDDDLGLRAEVVREILESRKIDDITELLPGTAASFKALAMLGKEDLGTHLESWNHARQLRLKHFPVRLTAEQLQIVQRAVARITRDSEFRTSNPRGEGIYEMARRYLEKETLA